MIGPGDHSAFAKAGNSAGFKVLNPGTMTVSVNYTLDQDSSPDPGDTVDVHSIAWLQMYEWHLSVPSDWSEPKTRLDDNSYKDFAYFVNDVNIEGPGSPGFGAGQSGKLTVAFTYNTADEWGSFDAFVQNMAETSEGAPVPEPATMLLLGSGLLGMGVIGRRKMFRG